ncbi:hypothetical protein ACFOZY_13375 [Chungangia koreensis]|uniref:Uncharacterized protein n=1 Tax=Chungangia koreensis TaxID=752657 RepID=A0ABV8X8Q8_9LACT
MRKILNKILVCLMIAVFFSPSVNASKNSVEQLEKRLKSLEPEKAVDIEDPPWKERPFPTIQFPISKVISTGTQIPFQVILDKPDYQRPAFKADWHSSVGRWSYVPTRVHFALHRLFTAFDLGLSGWYDFEGNLGINVEMSQSDDLDLYIVAFQTEITKVYTKGNQIVVVGRPKRNGVQAITIKVHDLKPNSEKESLLVQLATEDGDEIDYSLNEYLPPDIREKIREGK